MTVDIKNLDAHEQPSDELRAQWKAFSRAESKDLLNNKSVDDLLDPECAAEFCQAGTISVETLNASFRHICPSDAPEFRATDDVPIYYHPLLPGLLIVPSLVPPAVQKTLLNHLIHQALSQPAHQTNLHLHYDLPYPSSTSSPSTNTTISPPSHPHASFFTYPLTSPTLFPPKDPTIHKPLTIKQVLERKLHWVTLGRQYDWTNRVYPDDDEAQEGQRGPPRFPQDVARFLETLFPATKAQAAIVNFYTPGDTMMMHRDVSEEVDRGLVSVSLGCEGLFMIAPNRGEGEGEGGVEGGGGKRQQGGGVGDDAGDGAAGGKKKKKKEFLLLRLRSGDAIYMTKESRFAWHGVPKVLKGTCPGYLEDWPAEGGQYEEWRGWMRNKRINFNVRQMRE